MVLLWFVVAFKHQASHPLFHENSRKLGYSILHFQTHMQFVYIPWDIALISIFQIFHGIMEISWYFMGYIFHFSIIWNLLYIYIRYIPWNIHDPRLPPVWVGYSLPPFCAGWFKSQPAFPWNYHSTPTFGRLNTPFVSICNLLIKDIPWYSHILLIFPVYSQYVRTTIMLKTSSFWVCLKMLG